MKLGWVQILFPLLGSLYIIFNLSKENDVPIFGPNTSLGDVGYIISLAFFGIIALVYFYYLARKIYFSIFKSRNLDDV